MGSAGTEAACGAWARAAVGVLVVALALCVVGVRPAASASPSATAAAPARPLRTAVVDPPAFARTDRADAFAHVRRAGAGLVRLILDWAAVAPRGSTRPSAFRARDHEDPGYRWEGFDAQVREAVAAGLVPVVDLVNAPAWAQDPGPRERPSDGPRRPMPTALEDFAFAAATRYGGGIPELPRVRHWQVWNEPNLSYYLNPQEVGGRLFSPAWYRAMVNSAAKGLRRVHGDNLVVAGGLAPHGPRDTRGVEGIAPLRFMRAVLCMSAGPRPRPTCRAKVAFDVWSTHPYTSGGPTTSAGYPDDVSLGDLAEVHELLRAAERAGHVDTRRRVGLWVTEFSWDTRPPDPRGVPLALHARWVSEALYRMWRAGVDLVTWYGLRDAPYPREPAQSGLYFRSSRGVAADRPKRALRAFRFPFVALREGASRIVFWGRIPDAGTRTVVVEQSGP
ncbi:MAG TPA: hypothetical protein VH572_11970, partial [Gaiella sp.]